MATFIFKRRGDRPLQCEGELAALFTTAKEKSTRWFEARVVDLKSGRRVIAVEYHTAWNQEENIFHAAVVEADAVAVKAWLDSIDPQKYVVGFPPGIRDYKAKQARIEMEIALQWDSLRTNILSQFGPEVIA